MYDDGEEEKRELDELMREEGYSLKEQSGVYNEMRQDAGLGYRPTKAEKGVSPFKIILWCLALLLVYTLFWMADRAKSHAVTENSVKQQINEAGEAPAADTAGQSGDIAERIPPASSAASASASAQPRPFERRLNPFEVSDLGGASENSEIGGGIFKGCREAVYRRKESGETKIIYKGDEVYRFTVSPKINLPGERITSPNVKTAVTSLMATLGTAQFVIMNAKVFGVPESAAVDVELKNTARKFGTACSGIDDGIYRYVIYRGYAFGCNKRSYDVVSEAVYLAESAAAGKENRLNIN